MTLRHLLYPLLLSLPLALVACGDDGDGDAPTVTDPTGPAGDGFADSDAFTERFGTRTARDANPDVDDATRDALVDALNDFSLELHRAVASADPGAGTVSSGYGAATALSLALAGTAGDTRSALANLLGVAAIDESAVHAGMNALAQALEARSNDDLVLRTANRAFVRPGLALRDTYLDVAVGDYGAPVTEADFAGATDEVTRRVNAWVSARTDGFIDSIVERVDPGTVFALLNALFLDAAWSDTWSELAPLDFTTADGTTAPVPAFGGRETLGTVEADGVRGVELPYAGGELAMLILVPDELASFEGTLDAAALDALVAGLASSEVQLRVPKWEDDADIDLSTLLAPLGLPANPWDFGRMIESDAPTVDVTALQKARIEVDENGTRAAAVTGVVGVTSLPPGDPVVFDVDRPFVYVLRDRPTGTVLFTGRVLDPGA